VTGFAGAFPDPLGDGIGKTGARPRPCNPAAGSQPEGQWCAEMMRRAEGAKHGGEGGCSASECRG